VDSDAQKKPPDTLSRGDIDAALDRGLGYKMEFLYLRLCFFSFRFLFTFSPPSIQEAMGAASVGLN
jgi:hypothetical protein